METHKILIIIATIGVVLLTVAPTIYKHFRQNVTSAEDTLSSQDRGRHLSENRYLPTKDSSYGKYLSACSTINIKAVGCSLCKVFVSGVQNLVRKKSTHEDIVKFAREICTLFKIEDSRVCDSIVIQFKDELFGVVDRLALTPAQACGILIGTNCGTPDDPNVMWNVTLSSTPKPPVVPPTPPKPGSPKLRMLHITDIHLDPAYMTGSNTNCGEPLCCRRDDGMAPSAKFRAGKWGSQAGCDLPYITLENLFVYLSSIKDQFDYVIFTGDLPPHNIWNQSREDQLTSLQTYTKLFKKYLPDKLVFNALGNHESAPVNSFPPDFIRDNQSITWLYEALADSWGNWLPNTTREDIIRGAFYTVSPSPGFRVISLNMNFCNNGNWWLLINTTDPNGELQWLINVLQKAEDAHEKVHIIGHIFPGSDDCLKAWSWNYFKIVNRYESTIAGQFFGHAHPAFYEVMYDNVNFTRPISVVYIPGSVTTFVNLNPGFRIYELDGFYKGSSWATLNYQNYFLNLTDVNVSDKPSWKLEYDAKVGNNFSEFETLNDSGIYAETEKRQYDDQMSKFQNPDDDARVYSMPSTPYLEPIRYRKHEAFNLTNLFPEDWDNLIRRMKSDDNLFQKFYRFYTKSAGTDKCTGDCKTSLLCDLRTGRSHDPSLCTNI